MSAIADRFSELQRTGRKGFIPFVTAGDPDVETSLAIVIKLARLGADVIELGVPFSDPVADGPTIQRSSQRALANGVNVEKILAIVDRARKKVDTPIVLFSYFNPLFRYGLDKLSRDAASAGVNGLLISDLVDDEADSAAQILGRTGLDLISLIAPTTSQKRLESIVKRSTGFLYAVSRAGVTGARSDISSDAEALVRRCKGLTDLPVAVGFGISTRDQIADVWRYADAAVVGSAIVAEIERSSNENAVERVEDLVRSILPQFAISGSEL